jgi:hypothetical protein
MRVGVFEVSSFAPRCRVNLSFSNTADKEKQIAFTEFGKLMMLSETRHIYFFVCGHSHSFLR